MGRVRYSVLIPAPSADHTLCTNSHAASDTNLRCRLHSHAHLSISMTRAFPHPYPQVVALSRTFKGFATFGRLVGDVNGDTRALIKELNIIEVPTFIFFRAGK